MNILITGGHLTPALALIDYLQAHAPENSLVFVGREFARAKQQVAHERREVTARNVPFVPLHSGKLIFSNPLQLIPQSVRIVAATLRSFVLLLRHRPDVCVSFGSYLAVPVALAAWLLRIPIITHEQTKTAGFANRIIGILASKVAISYPESKPLFPKRKTVLTGNLIRERVLQNSTTQPNWFQPNSNLPILYVTGGSQGSEIINSTIAQMLKPLLKDWCVIHQCGNPTKSRDYAAELRLAANQVSARAQQRYFVREWITDTELAWIYSHATAAVSRAGANSVEELALRRVPTIFIPLPFALNDEQQHNAEALSLQGQAVLLPQKELSPESLLTAVTQIKHHEKKIRRKLAEYQSKASSALPSFWKLIRQTTRNP